MNTSHETTLTVARTHQSRSSHNRILSVSHTRFSQASLFRVVCQCLVNTHRRCIELRVSIQTLSGNHLGDIAMTACLLTGRKWQFDSPILFRPLGPLRIDSMDYYNAASFEIAPRLLPCHDTRPQPDAWKTSALNGLVGTSGDSPALDFLRFKNFYFHCRETGSPFRRRVLLNFMTTRKTQSDFFTLSASYPFNFGRTRKHYFLLASRPPQSLMRTREHH